jgi:hypothetical protein
MNRAASPLSSLLAVGAIAGLALAAACSTAADPVAQAPVGSASAAIAVVPGAVSCVRLAASGSRSVSRDFDVTPGQSALLVLPELPIGDVSFAALAYPVSCGAVQMGGVQPSWSAPPVLAAIVAGQQTNLTLHLTQVGSAGVDVQFDGLDMSLPPDLALGADLARACLPVGAFCISNSQCCSNSCNILIGCN